MHGHVDRKALKITGCHHCNNDCLTITKTKTFDCGISIAKVKCGPYEKNATSLFPDLWTHSKIIDVMLECLESENYKTITKIDKNLNIFELKTSNNFTIELTSYIANNYIESYYPQIKSLKRN